MENIPDYLLVILIPVLVQLVKFWVKKANPSADLKREVITVVVFLLSIGAGVYYFAPELPAVGDDPAAYIVALLGAGVPFFAAVEALYNLILKRLFEAIGFSA